MDIKAHWFRLKERYDAMSVRERGLTAAAAIGGVLMLANSLFVEPQLARAKALRASIEQQRRDIANLNIQLVSLSEQAKKDPDAARRAELETLKAKLAEFDGQIAKREGAYVPPDRMNAVLETIVKRYPGLRLVSFKTLTPVALLGAKADKAEAPSSVKDFDVFRHGVEIKLEGSYGDLHAYLAQLEQGPQKLLWGGARLTVVEYPKAILTLVVYTLSSDKAWLVI